MKFFVLFLSLIFTLLSFNLFANERYIVVYKNDKAQPRDMVKSMSSVKALGSFENEITADVITANKKDIAKIKKMDQVDYVEVDKIVKISETWGLDRIDDRSGLDDSFEAPNDGAGVHTYIVDTGVNTKHNEFQGRIGNGFSAVEDSNGFEDCNGHGTHVAGTVAGTVYGVAKKATIHPVRVLNCEGSGYTSGVIAGVEWVGNNHIKPAVANMSLGGSASQTLDDAMKIAIGKGVSFVVAAGNSNDDACTGSPSGVDVAITVGATDNLDNRASFSSYGDCVDVFAPGVGITSAWKDGVDATNTISGTSMAAPHVAGSVALYLKANPEAMPGDVNVWMQKTSTKDVVKNAQSRKDHIIYVGSLDEEDIGDPEPEPDPKPKPDPKPPGAPYHLLLGDNGKSCIQTCDTRGMAYHQEGTLKALRRCRRTLFKFGYKQRRVRRNDTKNGCGMYDKASGWYGWYFNGGWKAREATGDSFDADFGGFRRVCACS